jgi:hypothetical protein
MEPALRIQFSLAQVKAVLAGKVTPWSTGFCHEIESGKAAGRHDFLERFDKRFKNFFVFYLSNG